MPNPSKATSPTADFTKYFASFQIPGFDVDEFLSTQRKNFDAVSAAGQLAFEGYQTAFRRQIEMVTELAGKGTNGVQDLFTGGTPQDKLAKQADAFKASVDKGLANLREILEIIGKSNSEAAEVLTKRFGEGLGELKTAVKI
jgi:phasin family protein